MSDRTPEAGKPVLCNTVLYLLRPQVLLEAVKPVLEEEQLQDAVECLLMETASYDAKVLYNSMKVSNVFELIIIFTRIQTDSGIV